MHATFYCQLALLVVRLLSTTALPEEFLRIESMRRSGELRKACSQYGNAIMPVTRVNTTVRLKKLREIMMKPTVLEVDAIDAYIITSDDEHQTEFVDEYDKRREFITGFSGGVGTAVVTLTKAALWTDGRFHLEADDQMGCEWLLMREGQRDIPTITEWLHKEFPYGGRIGVDPKYIAEYFYQDLRSSFKNSSIKLVDIKVNLIDLIWTMGRPVKRYKPAFIMEESYSGKSWVTKIEELRNETKKLRADAMVVTALDEIAWLLNIRGRDVPYSPFLRSFVLVDKVKVIFYVNQSQLININVSDYFYEKPGVSKSAFRMKNYEDFWTDLPTQTQVYSKLLIPTLCEYSLGASHAIYNLIPVHKQLAAHSPIIYLKAVKNVVEIEGMRKAHIRDAVALCEFFSYFETRFKENDKFTELDVVKLLNEFRFAQELSLGNSFRTIVAFGPNAAYPNYEPTNVTNLLITNNNTLLLDSGGQYADGTTDVTRTIHLGTPTDDQKRAYTRVLMGHIQVSSLTFPENMQTSLADVMVRSPLWEVGIDYLHGTSHGIGAFLGVHESPISVHFTENRQNQTFKPGYFFTIEPGFYREHEYGIRLENVLEVIEKKWLPHIPESGYRFLGFKEVTLVPFDLKMIDLDSLSSFHKRWLNNYNRRIRDLVGRELKRQNLKNGFRWMMAKTKYIPENGSNQVVANIFFIVIYFVTVF